MANYLTPADRRARTQLMRMQRDPAYRRQKEKEELQRLEAAQAASVPASAAPKEESNGFVTALHTVGDVGANVLTGLGKGLEGIYDLGAGLVGAVGGLFSDEFENDVKEHIARDFTGELYGNAWQEALDQSALNNSKVGQIIEGVAQGVGQMLPAVAVSLIPGVGPALGAKLALGTTIASAAGTSTEQAFQDGADYGEGMLYGAASGAIEGVTEKLTGGAAKAVFGKGLLDDALGSVAKTGIARVAKDAVGEGVEEMTSEVLGQGAKAIYKGADAFKEYGEADFWAGVGEAGIIGAGTSVAYGGTVGKLTKTSGAYADARSVMEHMDTQQKLRSKKGLSQADLAQIEKNIKADQELLSKRLQRLSKDKRAAVLKKMPALSAVFDEDGSINAEQRAALDANIKAAEDTTYDARYRTSTLGAETIDATLKNGSTDSHEMRAFSGELNAEQQAGLDTVREMMGAVAERSGNALGGYVVTQTSPKGGAYFDPNTRVMTIGADTLNSGNVSEAVARALESDATLGTIVHEVTHGIEETNAGKALAKLLTDNTELHDLAITDVLERGYLKDYFGKDGKPADVDTVKQGVAELIERENAGQTLTDAEQAALDEYRSEVAAFATQRLLGNKAFMKKLITTDPSTAEKLIGKIRELYENFKVRKDPAAKAQLEIVRKAEKLFMQGLSEAGGTIDSKGKIHLANREEDEELTRENSEKMHDSEENGGENAAEDASGENKRVRRLMAGEHAKNANIGALATARQMAFDGADSEAIRQETGWFQGYDGKWRFEINDSDVEFAFNGKLSRDPDVRRYAELVQKVYFDGTATDVEQGELTALDKKLDTKSIAPDKLGDMMQHPTLFEAYPQLADLSVRFTEGTNSASYHAGAKEITVPKRLKMDPKKFKSAILHEVQHAVQDIERFASGSNVNMFADTDEQSAYDQYYNTAGEIEARDVATRGDLTAEQRKNTRPDIDRSDVVFADAAVISNDFAGWTVDGNEVYITSKSTLGMSVSDRIAKFKNDFLKQFRGRTAKFERNGHLHYARFVESTGGLGKMTYEGSSKSSPAGYKAKIKMLADGNVFELVEDASYRNTSPETGKTTISHKNAKHWDYYVKTVVVDGKAFDVVVNVRVDVPSGDYGQKEEFVYSILFRDNKKVATSVVSPATSKVQRNNDVATNNSIPQNAEKSTPSAQENFDKVRRSRTASGDVVTISKGELAKLHANYAGEKTFAKKDVVEALKSVEALKVLPAARRTEIANEIWKGYNQRLHQQGFEMFTELAWHELHAEVMQETSFEMSDDAIRAMDEQIVAALHQIVASGKPSIKAKLESATSTEGYRKQAEFWREEHGRATARHKKLNSLKYELENLANQKKGRYVNAANYRGDSFNVAINELAKMNWRGGLVNDSKIREHFASLAAWYTKENPLYKGGEDGNSNFRQEISDALNSLGNSQNGALTVEDLQVAETVVKYFAHEIEAHNTVYKDGKRVDAMPEAKAYIEKVQRAKEISVKCGIWGGLMRSGFARMVADPAMLMRQADGYLNGFFTEQYEQLRQGTIDGAVKEREISEEFEQFWEKNKAYGKRYNTATVTFDGVEMPLQEGIMLYMTMHRDHAFAGLAGAGFEIDGKHATENISDGFAADVEKQIAEDWKALPPEELLTLTKKKNAEIERAALAKVVEQKRQALYDQFTAEDKALIEIMERGYEACREVKVKIDEIVQGYTNVTGGYYCPIRRAGLAENVDAYTGFEGDRVTNLSMNKDTVKNAHKLYIEPAHVVFMRHVKATALYHGLGVFTDNFNRLYNLNIGTNANNPITVRTALGQSNKFTKEMVTYFKELKQDVEGISKKRNSEKFYNDAVAFIRSSYATYQLGANPKVWVTQLSSFLASTSIIDADCLAKGVTVSGKDVDKYCRLAWLRNGDDSAAMAQAVSTPQNAVQRAGRNVLQKIRDVAMWPIGRMDRLVITRLFGACQVQIEKKGGAKVGTEQNKIEAGKLMTRVILETQQNSLATERSAAMRSGDELLKGLTMFSADAMKVGARFVDAFGELSALKTLRKEAKKAGNGAEVERLNKEIKRAKKQCVRASVSLVSVALFNALLAYGFKWLYRRDEDESVGTVVADTFGNMLGGIPLVRDLWGFFQDGFEMDHFLIGTVNDVLGTASATFELLSDAMSGKEVTKQQAMSNMRKVLYAAGQLSGVPVRNVYNVTTGFINRVSPEVGYSTEALFTAKAYSSDLKKAMEAGDEDMVATIAGLMLDEKSAVEDSTRQTYRDLIGKGYSVLPRSVGDSITVDGEKLTLTGAQQKRFRSVYDVGQKAVADLCKLSQFKKADDAVQAKAIQFVNDVYWELAVSDLTGADLAEKNVLFAEAIPIEKLAIIIATARAIEADKDKSGKAIAGSKKRKVQTFVNSLHLSAAQKYMVMGYLGYSNINGAQQVKSYIGRLGLSKKEQAALMKYSGYAE